MMIHSLLPMIHSLLAVALPCGAHTLAAQGTRVFLFLILDGGV